MRNDIINPIVSTNMQEIFHSTSMNDVIDLCSSDDDSIVGNRPNKYFLEVSDDEDCQSVDEMNDNEKSLVTPENLQKENDDNDDECQKSRKPASLFTKSSTQQSEGVADSSDDDDEWLKYQGLTTRKKKPSCQPRRMFAGASGNISATSNKENNSMLLDAKKMRTKSPQLLKTPPRTPTQSSLSFNNPYAKIPRRQSDSHLLSFKEDNIVQYPIIARSGQYADLRVKYLLAFWSYSQKMVYASHNLGKLDQFSKRINSLALSRFPIRSFEEYCQRFTNIGDTSAVQEALRVGDDTAYSHQISTQDDGRYFSIAEACLVSMLSHVESRAKDSGSMTLQAMEENASLNLFLQGKQSWIFVSDLLPMIDSRLKDICPGRLTRHGEEDNGVSHYIEKTTRSTEYRQLEKLQTKQRDSDMSYIKAHRQNGKPCFELTTLGYTTAIWIRRRAFPSSQGHYRTSNLVRVEKRFQGICLAVDNREGGGPKKKLHSMLNKLDTLKIPYFVCTLNIGDYSFFTANKLLPVLIERKSIQDVAHSIFDGRWKSQKLRMYQGQFVFGYKNCRMAYIIEGRKETQQLTGGYVGQRQFNVTSEQLDEEIANLEAEGFDVLRTQ